MKIFLVIIILTLPCLSLFSQKTDSLTLIKPVVKTQTTNPKVKPASMKIREIGVLLNEMELKLEEIQQLAQKLKTKKETISEMSDEDMMMLNRLMQKKNQLEQMISNIMKSATESVNSAVSALKAS